MDSLAGIQLGAGTGSGEHFARDHADCPEVPTGADVVAGHLFGPVVKRQPEQTCAAAGDPPGTCESASRDRSRAPLAQRRLRPLEEDILRLQVAVHETLEVGCPECGADSSQDVKRLRPAQRNALMRDAGAACRLRAVPSPERPLMAVDSETDAGRREIRDARGGKHFLSKSAGEIGGPTTSADQFHGDWPLENIVHG